MAEPTPSPATAALGPASEPAFSKSEMMIVAAARERSPDAPAPWFQLYIQPDLDFTAAIAQRAEAAGCAAPRRRRRHPLNSGRSCFYCSHQPSALMRGSSTV